MSDSTEEYENDMLECEQSKTDALEGIRAALATLAASKGAPAPAPVVNVAAPAVNVTTPPPAPVTVNIPKAPQRWTVEVTERDNRDRIKKFTMTAS